MGGREDPRKRSIPASRFQLNVRNCFSSHDPSKNTGSGHASERKEAMAVKDMAIEGQDMTLHA
jgi:hypothetical protein